MKASEIAEQQTPVDGYSGADQEGARLPANTYAFLWFNPLYHVDPEGLRPVIFIVSAGGDVQEMWGHSAMLVDTPSGRRETMSRGSHRALVPSVAAFINDYLRHGRRVTAFALIADPARDEQLALAVKEHAKKPFKALRQNCTTGTAAALRDVGVCEEGSHPERDILHWGLLFDSPSALDAALEAGALADQTEDEIIIFDPFYIDRVTPEIVEQYLKIPDSVVASEEP